MTWPESIPTSELERTHPRYDAQQVKRHQALYEGGKAFRAMIKDFLLKRRLEELQDKDQMAKPAGQKSLYEERIARAWYIPRGAGLIDWLVAAIHRHEPQIVVKNGTPEQKEYWEGLNRDCDGSGLNLPALTRRITRSVLLHRRGYFAVSFPSAVGQAAAPKTKDALLYDYDPVSVSDWETDERGNLSMVRLFTQRAVRSEMWKVPDRLARQWTFITPDAIAVYENEQAQPAADATGKASQADAVSANATRVTEDTHTFGMPVFPVQVGSELHVMGRIEEILTALFNRETSITHALDQMAFALLVLKLGGDKKTTGLVAADLAALVLSSEENETAAYISPQPTIMQPLFDDEKRLVESLYQVLQMAALAAVTTQTQNPRQAGVAKAMDRDPLVSLLYSYAWPVRDALESLIAALKKYRSEEDLDVRLIGFDGYEDPSAPGMDELKEQIESTTRAPDQDDETPVVEKNAANDQKPEDN